MRTFAGLVFIAAVAALAVWLWRMDTVVDGSSFAAKLLDARREAGVTTVDCDKTTPVTPVGAAFECRLADNAGHHATVVVTIDQVGRYNAKVKE